MKQHRKYCFYILILIGIFSSCKKENELINKNLATISVIYAVAGSSEYKINFGNENASWSSLPTFNYHTDANYFASNSIAKWIGLPTDRQLKLKVALTTDTMRSVFDRSVKLQNGDVYTLVLAGTSTKVDTLFLKESMPEQQDNVAGIRFMNLSSDLGKINISMQGYSIGSTVKELGYLEYTDFKTFQADASHNNYIFEFRNAENGDLIGSYNFNPYYEFLLPKSANVTLLVRGSISGNPSIEIARANNY